LTLRLLLIVILAALGGCGFGSGDSEPGEVTQEGVDFLKNPLKALGALQDLVSEAENLQKELENMPEVETVHFSKLIEALPDVPAGWTATDPKGATTQMAQAKISNAKREYREEGGKREISVSIDDFAFHQMLYMPFFMAAKFSQETTEGYRKGITVGEWPGMDEYNYERKSGQRALLVHKRYHVKISLINSEPEEFDTWMKRVKTDILPVQ